MKIKKIKYAKKVQKKFQNRNISICFPFETKWSEEWADEAKLL